MKTRQITELGMLLALSLVLAYLESLLPVLVAVPGVKIGLANVVTMLVLYLRGGKTAFSFMILRVAAAGFLFSGVSGIAYSLAGGVCCVAVMCVTKRFSFFSVAGVSITGALAHNLGQILVAWFVMKNARILYYFPVLAISGMLSGMAIGIAGGLLIGRWKKEFPDKNG
ncbi:MAG: Gx transporter family protein [Clostridium sp.]|nr:Gx transporter family protein [Clostridium sp.]